MSVINDLVDQIDNPDLRLRIQQEVAKMSKQRKFGLVFEDHVPENIPLYELPIRRGLRVAKRDGDIRDNYQVLSVKDGIAECEHLDDEHAHVSFPVDDLIAVAQFGEPIYPCLKPMDSVCNAPDCELWHTLIQADNYHALQLLVYLYGGKVDCIYIDPPYNTGARDWKYNNDYVDGNDGYRHSKWLSMMEKRLLLAKKLLNPNDSVLIVTIDEKEYLHLGCLLEELFPDAKIQMVTSVINPSGSARKDLFSRAEEYLFYVFVGNAKVCANNEDMIHPPVEDLQVRWASLLRSGSNSNRQDRPKLFYPIFFRKTDGKFVDTGDSLAINISRNSISIPDNCFAVFPMKSNGSEARWTLSQDSLKEKLSKGYVKFGSWKEGQETRTISYLSEGMERALNKGELETFGYDEDGTLITGQSFKPITPLTVWNKPSHSAGDFGSSLLLNFFESKRFSFPKSLYAVYDTIRFFVGNKPNALIVDFFAGSGTTLHAVNLLNKNDGGNRRCIMVTNNEVSEDEAKELKKKGLRPNDRKWEELGIAQYVTWPRTTCSIKGINIKGESLKGNYLNGDIPMSEGFKSNAVFFKLGFLDKTSVALGRQFKELLPILWMKAGARGECPTIECDELPKMLVCEKNHFAVLIDENAYPQFEKKLNETVGIDVVYIITDSDSGYKEMAQGLHVETTYQLYRDYLDNFRINNVR